jgi:hypothetical protein
MTKQEVKDNLTDELKAILSKLKKVTEELTDTIKDSEKE